MTTPDSIRLLSVDDHPLIRDGIAYALRNQSDMQIVAEATNGMEAVEAYRRHLPDVTLMDLQMPEMNGLEAIGVIRREFPGARVVVLTTYSGDIQATRALKAGAAGYLLKSMLSAELVDTIRAVHQGRKHIPEQIACELAEHIGSQALSDREVQILRGVASGCSNKAIADQLSISEETVKAHLKSVFSKLGTSDRTHAVLTAMKRGFFDS